MHERHLMQSQRILIFIFSSTRLVFYWDAALRFITASTDSTYCETLGKIDKATDPCILCISTM